MSRKAPSCHHHCSTFYIADKPRPTDPVKRVCYADDINVWASGVNIPDLEVSINNYIDKITVYLKDNSLLISTTKSSVTLLTPDTHQAKTHPTILIDDSRLPLVKCPRILGVYLDQSLSFNNSQYVAERVSGRNILGTTKGNDTDDLQGSRKIDHQLRRTCLEARPTRHQLQKIQYTQNETLRIATGCHKMSSIDHLHTEEEMPGTRKCMSPYHNKGYP